MRYEWGGGVVQINPTPLGAPLYIHGNNPCLHLDLDGLATTTRNEIYRRRVETRGAALCK